MGMEVSAIVQAFERKKEQIEKDRDEALAANKAVTMLICVRQIV